MGVVRTPGEARGSSTRRTARGSSAKPERLVQPATAEGFFATVQEAAAQEVVEKASRRVRATIVALTNDRAKAEIRREYMTQSDGVFYPIDAQFQQFSVGDRVVCEESKGGLIIRSRLKTPTDKTVEEMVHRDGSRAAVDYPLQSGSSLVAVKAGDLDTKALKNSKYDDRTVNERVLGIGAVHEHNINTDAISRAKIQFGAVDTEELTTGAVTNSKIATGAVSPSKLDRAYAPPHSHPYASSNHGHGSHGHGSAGSHSHSLPSSAGGGSTGSAGSHDHGSSGV